LTSTHNRMLRRRTVHMVIHKCGQDSRHRAANHYRRHARSALETASVGHLARKPIRHPRFVVGRRSSLKRHCPKLTSFPSECQPFCNIGASFHTIARGPGWRVGRQLNIAVIFGAATVWFDPANAAAYPRTVARKSAIRLRSAQFAAGPAPVTSETQSLPRLREGKRVRPGFGPGRKTMPDATRRESWQRASGPSSRTTGAEPACTGSGCGCAPGRDARSCQVGAARAAAR
jgi:hypothetical protein